MGRLSAITYPYLVAINNNQLISKAPIKIVDIRNSFRNLLPDPVKIGDSPLRRSGSTSGRRRRRSAPAPAAASATRSDDPSQGSGTKMDKNELVKP